MSKRKNILLIAGIVLIAVLLLVFLPRLRPGASGKVLITVDGQEYGRYDLAWPQEISVELPDGEKNVVVITGSGVYMKSATCRDQLCVQQGEVTPENCVTRVLGTQIICLPHRVVVSLETNADTMAQVPDA